MATSRKTKKKPGARKAPARKPSAKKAPARKAAPKKTAPKKTAPKKAPAKKTANRKTPAKKSKTQKPSAARSGRGSLFSVLRDDGSAAARNPGLSKERMVGLYQDMVRVREFDRRMLVLQRQGRIGFYGPILGQEAATIGSAAAFEDRDWIFPALREGAIAMLRGLSMEQAVAQLVGNSMDRCKGRQMPCHFTVKEGNFYAMSSVIGTQISHAVGAAMAAKIRGDDAVMAGYMGDGATSANDFHAGMNFAAVYQAPVVLICQNNQWAISVPADKQSASETIAIKAEAYGMPSMRVDGNDILAVYQATRTAVERARSGGGPTFLELVTYRRLGHSSSDDPSKYRDEAEVAAWEAKDPVERFRRHLEKRKLWNASRQQELDQEIADQVNRAITSAEAAAPNPPESLITDVYDEPTPQLRKQLLQVDAEMDGELGEFPL